MHTAPDTPADTPSAPRSRAGARRWRVWLAGVALVLGGLWWWSGSAGSLGSALRGIAWLLPAGQSLHITQAEGSLRHGGQVLQLQWQSNGLNVQARHITVQLDWSRWGAKVLPLSRLSMETLEIDDQRPASEPEAMQTLQLPLHIDLPWQVDRLTLAGALGFEATGLQGHYRYNGLAHTLDMSAFEVAQGRYTLQAKLQAAAPMALTARLQGQVHTPDTARLGPMVLDAQATVEGSLAGPDARLNVQAQLQPLAAMATASAKALHMQLQAQIQPWQKQAIAQAQADWRHLNLAALWPGAPQTTLTGQATVTPDGPAWRIQARLDNQTPGPWDQHALPLSRLNLQLRGQAAQWQVQQLQAWVAGGRVEGEGGQTPAGWTGQVQVRGVQARQLHTALSSASLQGQIQAHTTDADAVSFVADLGATAGTATQQTGLRWDKLHLQGQWQGATWDIQSLDLQAADARLQGQFSFQPAQRHAQGQLQLKLPGLQAQAEGLLAPQQGRGRVHIDIRDAAQGMAWLRRWPGALERLQPWQAAGTGQLQAQWEGGFEQGQTPVQLDALLPRLVYQGRGSAAWQVPNTQITVSGRLQALQAQLDTRLQSGAQTVQVNTRLSAASPQPRSGEWQGRIESASALITAPGQLGRTGRWQAQLQEAVAWRWTPDNAGQALHWQAGQILWQGPTPGSARLVWDAGQWRQHAANRTRAPQPAASRTQLSARIDELPLSWIPGGLAPEIQSDLLLKGHVSWAQAESLQLQAVLERSRGDLRINAENAPGQRLNAGLSEARLQLQVDGEAVQAQLTWVSEQMGQAQAQVQTRLNRSPDGWHWSGQAPVSGKVKAQLPRVGAWSLLAPPGWRVQGTLDAQLELSGTRDQPQWQGHVQADNLAVRSAVQGIEFSQGQLRARVQGQQVALEQLSLRGAGAQGGELQARGQLNWLTAATSAANASPLSQVDMALNIQANALRVSNRADRRLTVSGQVNARMQQGQLQLRGQLQADQGLFILPEDSTPTLGQDVVVVDPRQGPVSNPTAPAQTASWVGTPDVQVTLALGPDFQIQGMGLSSRLTGQVNLLSNTTTQGLPRLHGEVRTEGGRYKAYGQQLKIETGLLRFNGPYDNPQLDILAIRPNLSQRVGVQISGTAFTPKVRLYADPDMPDADKLAWLVLGRSAAGGGAESAVLQQAALALLSSNGKTLSGEMASALGLDEISLARGSRSDSTATGAAVTLGKRLSKDFYLVYETSLRGTFGSFYVFYDLSRRLTLRAQTGQDNALDLIYTVRKD